MITKLYSLHLNLVISFENCDLQNQNKLSSSYATLAVTNVSTRNDAWLLIQRIFLMVIQVHLNQY